MELANSIIIYTAINSAIMVLVMIMSGTYFGISFGEIKSALFKCMIILVITSTLSVTMGGLSILFNLIIWFLGLMMLFNLEVAEVAIFVFCLNIFTICITGLLLDLGVL